jgi:hypothetical protein
MLDGVYVGVPIEPRSIQDRLVRKVFERRQLARVREMGLLVAAITDVRGSELTNLHTAYKEAVYPPLGDSDRKMRMAQAWAMQHFDELAARATARDLKRAL